MKNTALSIASTLIVILTTVCFGYNSSILDQKSVQDLDQLVLQLDSLSDYSIDLSGHTDNSGSNLHNNQLSEDRALAVKNYLISKNVDSTKISLMFYGEEQPLLPNTSAENMALNRRVEITINGVKSISEGQTINSSTEAQSEIISPQEDEKTVAPAKSELKKKKAHRRLVWTGWKTGFHWSSTGRK